MAASTPIYDQFARGKPSMRSVQPVKQSPPISPSKNSISFVTSTPVCAPNGIEQQQRTGRLRPQSQLLTNQYDEAEIRQTSDLKHSRSQSHALFPFKRKEVNKDTEGTLKRAQSVLDQRGSNLGMSGTTVGNSSEALHNSNNALAEKPLSHRAAVSGATGYVPAPEATSEAAAFSKKFVVVGDGGSGKTCLLMRYKERTFPDAYVPTVFENYITHKHHRGTGKTCEVALWDTAGQEEYDRLRPLSYPETDVLLVCFAIDCPQSLDSVKEKWYPEVLHFCPTTPLILVGCKSDLRDSDKAHDQLEGQGLRMLTVQQGLNIANYIGAEAYMECSSKEMVNVDEVFELSMDIAVGTETGVDWRNNSVIGRMLSKGELGGASQLSRRPKDPAGRGEGASTAASGGNAGSGIGFVGKGSKGLKKKRRGACKIL